MANPVFFPRSNELTELREAMRSQLASLAHERAGEPPDNVDMQTALAAIQRLAEEVVLLRLELDPLRAKSP